MVKCEAKDGACPNDAIEIMWCKGFEGDSDMPICADCKTAFEAIKRPASLGESPWRFKQIGEEV